MRDFSWRYFPVQQDCTQNAISEDCKDHKIESNISFLWIIIDQMVILKEQKLELGKLQKNENYHRVINKGMNYGQSIGTGNDDYPRQKHSSTFLVRIK